MLKNYRKPAFILLISSWNGIYLEASCWGRVRLSSLSSVNSSSFSPTLLQGFMALSALFKTPPLAQVTLSAPLCDPLPATAPKSPCSSSSQTPAHLLVCLIPAATWLSPPIHHYSHLMMYPIKKSFHIAV